MVCDVVKPAFTSPATLADPEKFATVYPLASSAVSVAGKGTPWICDAAIVFHWNDATGPGCTANVLLPATKPLPLTPNITPGSTPFTVTVPDHTPRRT